MNEMRGRDMEMRDKFILILALIMILLSGCTIDRIDFNESINVSVTNDVLNTTITGVVDSSTNSLLTVDYAHHEIHSGSHYFVVSFLDLAINQVLDITWEQSNTTSWTHFVWILESESQFDWHIYEDVTPINNLSNPITIHNSNRNSNKTSGTIMRYEIFSSLANANANTNIISATELKNGVVGSGNRLGGDFGRESEIILKQGSTYLLRGVAKGAGYITFDMEWYEHTNK